MIFITVLAALCSVLLVPCLAAPEGKIVGGSFAKPNQFPHQISLRKMGSHNCGGSIINEEWVVTAAHCVNAKTPQLYTVVAGSNTLNKGGVARKVQKIFVHEDYGNFLNDIALLHLSEPLEYSESIQPIEIFSEEVPAGSDIEITGWGRIYHGGPISNKLKFNTLIAITQEECSRRIGKNYAGLICLGHTVNNGACNGDSGGPATFEGKLVGVANFVYTGCATSYPDAYAKVSYFRNWIEEKMTE